MVRWAVLLCWALKKCMVCQNPLFRTAFRGLSGTGGYGGLFDSENAVIWAEDEEYGRI